MALPRTITWCVAGLCALLVYGCGSTNEPTVAHVSSVVIQPASPVVNVGELAQLTAELRDAAGNPMSGRTITWTSSNSIIAGVSATGLVSALQEGTVIITATAEDVEGHVTVTCRTPVATVTLSRSAVTIGIGSDFTFVAEARGAQGQLLTGRPVTWSSSTTGTATVSPFGVVTALATGTTTITATMESRTASAIVTVGAAVASVTITPNTLLVGAGLTVPLTATPRDAQGNALTDRLALWTTSNSAVATVSNTGSVTAIASGLATITVTIEGKVGVSVVTVRAADVAIQGAQLSQATQDANGSLSMVSGRAAVLTVVLTSPVSQTNPVELVLRLLNATNSVVYSDTLRRVVALSPGASLDNATTQFLIPATQLRAGLRWQVERDPRRLAPDDSLANDLFPRAAPASFTVQDVPPLSLRFVPIQLAANGNATGNVTNANLESYLYMVRRLLPVSQVNATVGAIFTSNVSFGTPPSGGAETFWTSVLQELDLARVTSGDVSGTHWYGILVPPAGFTFTQFGGFAYIPFSGTATGSGSRTALSVQLGWFNSPNLARDNIAHEIGHNFGRRHAPCGGPANPDPAFPVPGGFTGAVGFDVYGWSSGSALQATAQPVISGDIMGYCAPVWISPYTYGGMLAFRGTTVAAARAPQPALVPSYVRAYIVRGRVTQGVLALEPSFATNAIVEPEARGTHTVELLDATGNVVAMQQFTPARVDHSDAVQLFTVPIAITTPQEARVQSVRVTGPAGNVAQLAAPPRFGAVPSGAVRSGALRSTASTPTIARVPGATQWRISCPSRQASGALVRDASGAVVAVARGADVIVSSIALTVATRASTLVCSDGVRQDEFAIAPRQGAPR